MPTETPIRTETQDSPGPQTVEEAQQFYSGYQCGLTAYAQAKGESGLKSKNPLLTQLMDEEGWRTIETMERITGAKT